MEEPNKRNFSFQYNGEQLEFSCCTERKTAPNQTEYEYWIPDGLKITKTVTKYTEYDAEHWVLWLENTAEENSGMISELYDCDIKLPLHKELLPQRQGYKSLDAARIYSVTGFMSMDEKTEFRMQDTQILPGTEKTFRCTGGRSSGGTAPYFVECAFFGRRRKY